MEFYWNCLNFPFESCPLRNICLRPVQDGKKILKRIKKNEEYLPHRNCTSEIPENTKENGPPYMIWFKISKWMCLKLWSLELECRGPNGTFDTLINIWYFCHMSYTTTMTTMSYNDGNIWNINVIQNTCQYGCDNLRMDFYNPTQGFKHVEMLV